MSFRYFALPRGKNMNFNFSALFTTKYTRGQLESTVDSRRRNMHTFDPAGFHSRIYLRRMRVLNTLHGIETWNE